MGTPNRNQAEGSLARSVGVPFPPRAPWRGRIPAVYFQVLRYLGGAEQYMRLQVYVRERPQAHRDLGRRAPSALFESLWTVTAAAISRAPCFDYAFKRALMWVLFSEASGYHQGGLRRLGA